jgi:hypothetical protein
VVDSPLRYRLSRDQFFFALFGVWARVLAAEAFSALVDVGLDKTPDAWVAAFEPVCPLLPAACESALAAAAFSALVEVESDKTFDACVAAVGLVCRPFRAVMTTTFSLFILRNSIERDVMHRV